MAAAHQAFWSALSRPSKPAHCLADRKLQATIKAPGLVTSISSPAALITVLFLLFNGRAIAFFAKGAHGCKR
jgi:hypothetical protein